MSFVVGSGFLVLGRVRFVSLRSKRWISLSSPPPPPPPPMVGCCSSSDLQPPDLPLLADAARISLTQREVQEFAPKIKQVVDWFGQLQAVNLDNIEPSFRAGVQVATTSDICLHHVAQDTQVNGIQREDTAEVFENKEAILAAVPSYDEPYIKVPRVLNKE